jgi:hypothetical protein
MCHVPQVGPEALQAMMSTMTRSYGLQAVGRAAAATVMLPLAVGVDLIILPGPQARHSNTTLLLLLLLLLQMLLLRLLPHSCPQPPLPLWADLCLMVY